MKNNPYTQESIKASFIFSRLQNSGFFFSKSVKKSVKRGVRVFSVSPQRKSGKPQSGIRTGIGTGRGSRTGMGRETYI